MGGASCRKLGSQDDRRFPLHRHRLLRNKSFSAASRGYDARVEHRFTGPSYTLGIEEELMIVDQETLDLTNSIEGLLADLEDTGAPVSYTHLTLPTTPYV